MQLLTDELDETKMLVRRQNADIHELQEQVNQLQENQIQEECDRIEAEIARERAVNENRALQRVRKFRFHLLKNLG